MRSITAYVLNIRSDLGALSESREDHLYFVERVFDYNALLRSYMAANQEIVCNNCGCKFEIASLPHFQTFRMRCPDCATGVCEVVNLSKNTETCWKRYAQSFFFLKPKASDIAGELDCSGQLVGRRAKNLSERTLVKRYQDTVYRYHITKKATDAYFKDASAAQLNLDGSH